MAISIILFTAISIYSRQFQFVHGNFNLLTAILILICSWQFQFTHGNFNFFMAMLTAFFALLTTCLLRRLTVATKSQNQKSKFKVDLRVSDWDEVTDRSEFIFRSVPCKCMKRNVWRLIRTHTGLSSSQLATVVDRWWAKWKMPWALPWKNWNCHEQIEIAVGKLKLLWINWNYHE